MLMKWLIVDSVQPCEAHSLGLAVHRLSHKYLLRVWEGTKKRKKIIMIINIKKQWNNNYACGPSGVLTWATLCGVRHASLEVTFLCVRPTDCVGTFRIVRWKGSSQWAGRRRFFTSETVLLVSPDRDSRRGLLKLSKARGCLYLSACEPRVVSGSD